MLKNELQGTISVLKEQEVTREYIQIIDRIFFNPDTSPTDSLIK
jgi:hypothetical protein